MTEDDFLAVSVAHQLGDPGARLVLGAETRAAALAASSGLTLAWDQARQMPYPQNGWALSPKGLVKGGRVADRDRAGSTGKTAGALAELHAAGADFDLLIDMQDRRLRSLALPDGAVHPVVCFNRVAGAAGRILWPLPGYHDLGSAAFLGELDPAAVSWAEKQDRFAWRGIVGGRANPKGDVRREGWRLRPLLRQLAEGRIDRATAEATLRSFPRHRFVDRYASDPRADVGFVDGNGFTLRDEPMLAGLERPRLTRQDFQRVRYLVVLRGLDVGSSFFWTMNSGSLGLVMETPFQSFASVHFRPWEHYVPFREDLTDFEARLDWCRSHEPECRAMVAAAARTCRWLARADLRDRIARAVVAGLRERIAA